MQLHFPCAAERGKSEKQKQERDSNGNGDKPMRDVARPRAESEVQPGEPENSKDGSGDFVKKLLQCAPKTTKSSRLRCHRGRARCRGHKSILAQNRRRNPALRDAAGALGPNGHLNGRPVNLLETTPEEVTCFRPNAGLE